MYQDRLPAGGTSSPSPASISSGETPPGTPPLPGAELAAHPAPSCVCFLQTLPPAARPRRRIRSDCRQQQQKLPLRRKAARPGLGCQVLDSSSNDILEISGQQVPSRAKAVSPQQATQIRSISILECCLCSQFCRTSPSAATLIRGRYLYVFEALAPGPASSLQYLRSGEV